MPRGDDGRALRVLLVEDDVEYAELVRIMLESVASVHFQLEHVAAARTAIERLAHDQSYDVLLLDLGLPDAKGLEALHSLLPGAPDLPILILSGSENESQALRAVKSGAQDYLLKSEIASDGLARSIRYAIERKQSELEIKRLAYYDSLTQLPNRRMLMDRMHQAIARARRHGHVVGVVFLDIDSFKEINDTLGHDVGDRLLEQFAIRLQQIVRESDTVGRLSGDEFVAIAELKRLGELEVVAQTILNQLELPFRLGDQDLTITVSIGTSSYPADGVDAEGLLRAADRGMYRAKAGGREYKQASGPARRSDPSARSEITSGILRALEQRELTLRFQPIVNLRSGRIDGLEALVRWQHPSLGTVGPSTFIPIAEQSEVILGIGRWVLQAAMEEAVRQAAAGRLLKMAINLSRRHLDHPALFGEVKGIGRQVGYDFHGLELEVTESGIMREPKQVLRHLKAFRQLGMGVVVDDFGTGHSCLSLMKHFPVDALKIDKKFVRGCASDRTDRALIAAIINMAHALGLQVTAEGVETAEQLAYLREQDCDRAQGSYFSRPVSSSRLPAVLAAARTF